MAIFKIGFRWTDKILFEGEYNSMKECLTDAILRGANLYGANLHNADLRGANLHGANLHSADLYGADLRDAILRGANLYGANLYGADLRGANLHGADLCGADLRGTNLHGANLYGAKLYGANLYGADLRGANLHGANLHSADLYGADLRDAILREFKTDLIAEILKLPDELENLRAMLVAGKIDGSTYSGECACLAGTIANNRGISNVSSGDEIKENGIAFKVDPSSPREQWFMNIRKGDTPETNQCAKLALDWIDEAISIRDHIRQSQKN